MTASTAGRSGIDHLAALGRNPTGWLLLAISVVWLS